MKDDDATALIEAVARFIHEAETPTADPDVLYPPGSPLAKPRWRWHEGAARMALAAVALHSALGPGRS